MNEAESLIRGLQKSNHLDYSSDSENKITEGEIISTSL